MGGVSYRVAVAELSPVAPEGGGGRVLGAARCQWCGVVATPTQIPSAQSNTDSSEATRSMLMERGGGSTSGMVGTVAAPGEGDHTVGEIQQ